MCKTIKPHVFVVQFSLYFFSFCILRAWCSYFELQPRCTWWRSFCIYFMSKIFGIYKYLIPVVNLQHSVWLDEAFDRARQLYLSYYRSIPKSLERSTAHKLMQAMLNGDERFVEPTPQSLQNLTLQCVKDAVMSQFVSDNMEVHYSTPLCLSIRCLVFAFILHSIPSYSNHQFFYFIRWVLLATFRRRKLSLVFSIILAQLQKQLDLKGHRDITQLYSNTVHPVCIFNR